MKLDLCDKELNRLRFKIDLGDEQMISFDANSLYPSAMCLLDRIPDISSQKFVKSIDIEKTT